MGQWKIENDYYMSHPSGWTIAKYNVSDAPVYMLWQGDTPRGKRDSVREAMRLHTQLVEPVGAPEQAAMQGLPTGDFLIHKHQGRK